jgi:hypothetical protein
VACDAPSKSRDTRPKRVSAKPAEALALVDAPPGTRGDEGCAGEEPPAAERIPIRAALTTREALDSDLAENFPMGEASTGRPPPRLSARAGSRPAIDRKIGAFAANAATPNAGAAVLVVERRALDVGAGELCAAEPAVGGDAKVDGTDPGPCRAGRPLSPPAGRGVDTKDETLLTVVTTGECPPATSATGRAWTTEATTRVTLPPSAWELPDAIELATPPVAFSAAPTGGAAAVWDTTAVTTATGEEPVAGRAGAGAGGTEPLAAEVTAFEAESTTVEA